MSGHERTHDNPNETAAPDKEHPLPIGQEVTILRLAPNSQPWIEGIAIIHAKALGWHRYWVAFLGDPILRERVVSPERQPDRQPDSAHGLPVLTDADPPPGGDSESFADFFPDIVDT